MPFSIQDLLLGLLVPALAAALASATCGRLARQGRWFAWSGSLAVTGGFLAGYWLLQLGPIVPRLDRQWVPYAVLLALLPAMAAGRGKLSRCVQLAWLALVVLLAAWLLVPNRDSLEPSFWVHVAVWSLLTFAIGAGLLWIDRAEAPDETPVSDTTPPPGDRTETGAGSERQSAAVFWGGLCWLGTMAVALAFASALLALSGSLRFAQTAAAGMAALLGLAVGCGVARRRPALGGVALVYSLLICSVSLTGKVNSFSSIPAVSYAMLPLAPLGYGLAVCCGQRRLVRLWLPVAFALGVCGLALGLALMAELA
ncbi:MAG: hypothetical protein J5I93_21810 [Pirellulaceae bacterium]|nr:hypothetical protein [Pirellulaceae bacterium]